jgi:hypothetical protein
LVGNPGKIDGHIPPDKVPGIHPDIYDSICEATTDEERSKHCNKYEIDGKEIHLFNITGKLKKIQTMCLLLDITIFNTYQYNLYSKIIKL